MLHRLLLGVLRRSAPKHFGLPRARAPTRARVPLLLYLVLGGSSCDGHKVLFDWPTPLTYMTLSNDPFTLSQLWCTAHYTSVKSLLVSAFCDRIAGTPTGLTGHTIVLVQQIRQLCWGFRALGSESFRTAARTRSDTRSRSIGTFVCFIWAGPGA